MREETKGESVGDGDILFFNQVCCGLDHTLFLSDGRLLSCGWSDDGQTGTYLSILSVSLYLLRMFLSVVCVSVMSVVYVSVSPYIWLSLRLLVCLFLSVCLSVCLCVPVCLSVCLSVCLLACLPISLPVCMPYMVPYQGLVAMAM